MRSQEKKTEMGALIIVIALYTAVKLRAKLLICFAFTTHVNVDPFMKILISATK